ncbi:MAG: molecular chaperone TorD family protein [Coriobacteriales bacterium]|jgi:TorA maturation chaperone TorD|nr:molecular chaperone TorD family protein [Coriobacteriales bacterium]
MPDMDNVRVLLSARAGVYRTLQNALGNEPSREMLEQLTGDAAQGVLLLFDTGQKGYREAVESLLAVSAEHLEGGDEALSALEGRFTRLFVGPGGTEGNPWESFYLNTDKAIRQGVTLEVRKAYVAQGLIPQAYPSVSDDHMAIELDFLAKLAERAEEAWTDDDAGKALDALDALDASEAFLRGHLMRWAGLFAAALGRAKHGASFYQELSEVLTAFVPIDLEALAEIQNEIKG